MVSAVAVSGRQPQVGLFVWQSWAAAVVLGGLGGLTSGPDEAATTCRSSGRVCYCRTLSSKIHHKTRKYIKNENVAIKIDLVTLGNVYF